MRTAGMMVAYETNECHMNNDTQLEGGGSQAGLKNTICINGAEPKSATVNPLM